MTQTETPHEARARKAALTRARNKAVKAMTSVKSTGDAFREATRPDGTYFVAQTVRDVMVHHYHPRWANQQILWGALSMVCAETMDCPLCVQDYEKHHRYLFVAEDFPDRRGLGPIGPRYVQVRQSLMRELAVKADELLGDDRFDPFSVHVGWLDGKLALKSAAIVTNPEEVITRLAPLEEVLEKLPPPSADDVQQHMDSWDKWLRRKGAHKQFLTE